MLTSTARSIISTIAILAVVGCNSASKVADSGTSREASGPAERDITLVSGTESHAVTFFDSQALQYGTGRAEADSSKRFQRTASGLQYRILRESRGRKPTARNQVTVHYRGWLDNGKVFDASYDRGEPISFPLSGVVAGWTEGMQLIGEGGMIELYLPSRLGYGAQGAGADVPPYADLHFVVELIKVH